jgi:hypothetical protein
MADNLEQLMALRKAVDKLAAALRAHHAWHANAGEMGLCVDENGEWVTQDMSAEYGDSHMHEMTVDALSFAASVRGERDGSQGQ